MLSLQINLEFIERRCRQCGTYWALEKSRDYGMSQCPLCSGREVEAANKRVNDHQRVVNSLRGAITRLKKKARS